MHILATGCVVGARRCSDAAPADAIARYCSIAEHARDPATTRAQSLFTFDGLLPGQVDDDIAGDNFSGCVSSTRSIELDAKGPKRWHLLSNASRGRLSSGIETKCNRPQTGDVEATETNGTSLLDVGTAYSDRLR